MIRQAVPPTFTAVAQREGEYWFNMTRTVRVKPLDLYFHGSANLTSNQFLSGDLAIYFPDGLYFSESIFPCFVDMDTLCA
jgi:hypothetical protein